VQNVIALLFVHAHILPAIIDIYLSAYKCDYKKTTICTCLCQSIIVVFRSAATVFVKEGTFTDMGCEFTGKVGLGLDLGLVLIRALVGFWGMNSPQKESKPKCKYFV